MNKQTGNNTIERSPVIVIMGHIDHGKSTLLDYIRKTNIVEKEIGGITQKISAYEVNHLGKDGKNHRITFLDTPGHEAFQTMRIRGADVADIAVLVVSAEDGVKPQTLEALKSILKAEIPYIVAINKIDKPGADIERTKQSLAENEIYVEGYGGNIPWVAISAKNGQGVSELLDIMLLVAEMEELKGNPTAPASGVIVEANMDPKKGLTATLIIKEGTLKSGMTVIAEESMSPTRIMEDFLGKKIKEATFSSPIRIIGWNSMPKVGAQFVSFDSKKEAERYIEEQKNSPKKKIIKNKGPESTEECAVISIILKTDVQGTIEAIEHELKKLTTSRVIPKIINLGTGTITEADVKSAGNDTKTLIVGFNVKVDPQAKDIAERMGFEIKTFDIIYKLAEWLAEVCKERTPKKLVEEVTGRAKVLKMFSQTKDKQVIGARVEMGSITAGVDVRIMRRDAMIGTGKIKELQQQKTKTGKVEEGLEFGCLIQSPIEIAPGDKLELVSLVEK